MIIYVYDGSFEGLLTSIYESYYSKKKPQRIISETFFNQNLIDEPVYIKTDFEKSSKVYTAAVEKISEEAFERAYHVYLSEDNDAGTLVYNYLRLGFKLGSKVDLLLSNDVVLNMHKISRRVSLEIHRLTGLLRFVKLKGDIYYSSIEPDNNIVALLAPHFKQRFSDQNWIIHDTKRNTAALYNREEWIITDSLPKSLPSLSEGEELFQSLWKNYHKSISIEERKNSKLQRGYMPVRYWKNLIEMK